LRHNGVHFGPDYVPHGVKMLYDGKPVALTSAQEEVASYFSRYLDTDHMKKPQFPKNFFKEFRAILGKDHTIKEYSKCDFSPIFKHIKAEQEQRRNRSKDEKAVEKKEKDQLKEKYGSAFIDGRKEQVGNWTVEPPGLFLGRGDHPKSGMLKSRMKPEDVTLNLDEDAPIPACPVPGHKWGGIVHNHEVQWLAFWKNSITEEPKYVLFAATSSLKGQSDRKKFEKAKKLKSYIQKIRDDYMVQLTSKDSLICQRATAIWVIDHLALRVGGEKGEDEADTVGCCSLRCEHIKLLSENRVEFDFLGKDSMRYHNTVTVDPLVYTNLQVFTKGKKADSDIFEQLSPSLLNQYLQSLMEGLTAKVFRTYNASITMQNELLKMTKKEMDKFDVDEKVLFFNRASVQVAILCNHQRSVPKGHAAAMEKIDAKMNELRDEVKDLTDHVKALEGNKKISKENAERFPSTAESAKKKLDTLKERLRKSEIKRTEKDDLKEVSTSTSKINYIDPRVTIAWCNKLSIPLSKVFSKTVRDKFTWAIAECETDPNFEF
jgi:DNA topoisomerase-1